MEPDQEPDVPENPSRARRAKVLGAVSLVALAIAGVAYLLPAQPAAGVQHPAPSADFQLDAVDFITPSTGWVLLDLTTQAVEVLRTTDSGRHWTAQLTAPSPRHGEYMRFFDRSDGVVATIGQGATVFATRDGGAHWAEHPVDTGGAQVIAASFVDGDHGWVLLSGYGMTGAQGIMRTNDGAATWTNLGVPVAMPTEAFGVTFADRSHGWLDTDSTGPFAYTTSDAGLTWKTVILPAPDGGWPAPAGTFFVAARPTQGAGVMATVVDPYQYSGRSSAGSTVVDYPPLTMKTYDGGAPVVFIYTTLADSSFGGILHVEDAIHRPGPAAQVLPADQVGLTSTDGGVTWKGFATPGAGTIGYADALSWWWIGPGACSKSADAGRTWSPPQPCGVKDPLPGSLQVLDGLHAWVSAVVGSKTALFSTSDGGTHWVEASLSR